MPAQVYDYLRSGRLCRLQRYMLERDMDINGVFDLHNNQVVPVAMSDSDAPVDAVVLSVDIEVAPAPRRASLPQTPSTRCWHRRLACRMQSMLSSSRWCLPASRVVHWGTIWS